MSGPERSSCIRCGAPKGAGKGRRLCDKCGPARPPGHGCVRCLAYKPRDEFEQPGVNGRRRMDGVCLACRAEERAERERRAAEREAKRTTVILPPRPLVSAWFPAPSLEPGAIWRRCSCKTHAGARWLPIAGFPLSKAHMVRMSRYSYHCRRCIADRANARDKTLRNDPERAPDYRLKRNAAQRAWRQSNPERGREYERRWKARLREDPERYAAYLADQRITYRMRREAKGLPVGTGQRNATGRFVPSVGNVASLPPEPLALWLERLLALDHRGVDEIAEVMQVNGRALRRVVDREYMTVTEGMADALVWGYGRPVKMPDDAALSALLEARCRDLPGNGTRLLRYLDIGEQVAHLAGAVVDRVEDLWPALDGAG